MSRQPSDATQLRQSRRELKELHAKNHVLLKRAVSAEMAASEWKKRFDALVQRDRAVADAISSATKAGQNPKQRYLWESAPTSGASQNESGDD